MTPVEQTSNLPATVHRLAFVLGRNGEGGTEGQSKLLIQGLAELGIEVDVFLIEGQGGVEGFDGCRVEVLIPHRGRGFRALSDLFSAARVLRRRLRDRNYDVVHAAMARAYVIAPLVAPRTLVTVAWRRNLGIHVKPRSFAAVVEFLAARRTDMLVANSEQVAAYWLRRRHVAKGRLTVIGNGLDDWRFERDEFEPEPRLFARLICVGGLKPVKGHDILIKAAAEIRHRGWLVEVVLLGEGSERESIERLAQELEVPLIAPGHVADTREWLQSSTIYVHPSESEGNSNAILEAMAQALPVIASDVGGAKESLGNGALLFTAGNIEALVGLLEELLADSERRLSIGTGLREHAMQKFGRDEYVQRHLALYDSLLRRTSSRGAAADS